RRGGRSAARARDTSRELRREDTNPSSSPSIVKFGATKSFYFLLNLNLVIAVSENNSWEDPFCASWKFVCPCMRRRPKNLIELLRRVGDGAAVLKLVGGDKSAVVEYGEPTTPALGLLVPIV